MRSSTQAQPRIRSASLITPRYDFEYEEDDDEETADVDIENKYYNAKQLKLSDPEDAIAEFLGIPPLEEEKGEWGFKGVKQAIKLEFKLGQYDKVELFAGQIKDIADKSRLLNITLNSSLTSSRPLRATTPRSPSTTCSTTSKRERMAQRQ